MPFLNTKPSAVFWKEFFTANQTLDTQDFVAGLRAFNFTSQQNQKTNSQRLIDRLIMRDPHYLIHQRVSERANGTFSWAKTVARLRNARHLGLPKVS